MECIERRLADADGLIGDLVVVLVVIYAVECVGFRIFSTLKRWCVRCIVRSLFEASSDACAP